MEPAPAFLTLAAFDLMLLSTGRHWVASIREQEADPIPRRFFRLSASPARTILPN